MEQGLCRVMVLLAAANLAFGQVANRIVGGQNGKIGDWPWLVSVRYNSIHVCGGSILSPFYVLCAAHCFPPEHEDKDYEVAGGTTALSVTDPTIQVVRVAQSFKNPSYTQDAYSSDLAIIKLISQLNFDSTVNFIRLPSANVQFPAGMPCAVTGWGHIRQSVPLANPQTLQVGHVDIISRRMCNCLYKINPSVDTMSSIQPDMICAGLVDGSIDACQGDSGGPLSCHTNNNWYLAGVVSWGEECGAPNRPGVYIATSPHIDWIKSIDSNVQVDDFVVDTTPVPDDENGCKAADGQFYPYPNSAAVVLVTLGMLPLYWLTAYFLTDL